jgi:hypothetical protein
MARGVSVSVSNSDFNHREGYLEEQRAFQEKDILTVYGHETTIAFLNINDKGYRAKIAAWQNDRQFVLQHNSMAVTAFHATFFLVIINAC